MRKLIWLVAVFVALSFLVSAAQDPSARPMNNADVIAMVKAGLSANTIQLAITQAVAQDFDTSSAALIGLKTAGVPDQVIETMLRARRPSAVAASSGSALRGLTLEPATSETRHRALAVMAIDERAPARGE